MDFTDLARAFFDANAYLGANPDVAASDWDPFAHFLAHGMAEGRDPGPLFNTGHYLAQNPDVAAGPAPAFAHFLSHGLAEGRVPVPDFDAGHYLSANPDVAASGMLPFLHYALYGLGEGRPPVRSDIDQSGSGGPATQAPLQLVGSDGPDVLTGGASDDVLAGLGGDDVLSGGAGSDLFGFEPGQGHDTILDFSVFEDILRLKGFGIGDYADLADTAEIVVTEAGTTLSFDDGSSLILLGVSDPAALNFMPEPVY